MVLYDIIVSVNFPRLCNGSTADSGSACGGSNPPWGILRKPLKMIIFRGFRLVEQPMLFFGPFVYRLGHEILNLKRRVRFP